MFSSVLTNTVQLWLINATTHSRQTSSGAALITRGNTIDPWLPPSSWHHVTSDSASWWLLWLRGQYPRARRSLSTTTTASLWLPTGTSSVSDSLIWRKCQGLNEIEISQFQWGSKCTFHYPLWSLLLPCTLIHVKIVVDKDWQLREKCHNSQSHREDLIR